MPVSITISDVPPELKNGSCIPVDGRTESTTPMFMSICTPTIEVIPKAISVPSLSFALSAMLIPRHTKSTNQCNYRDCADKSQLLAHNCIYIIVMSFGQIEIFLP